jgi:hypothetical protein
MSLQNLPINFQGKLPCDNIDLVHQFIDAGVSSQIFEISSCKTFDCFVLLIESGCAITKQSFVLMLYNVHDWSIDLKKSFVEYVMNNVNLCEKLDLTKTILLMIPRFASSGENLRLLVEMVLTTYPWVEVNIQTLIHYHAYEFVGQFVPHFTFSSKELVEQCIDSKTNVSTMISIFKYCDPEDYLTRDIFRKIFRLGTLNDLKCFIEQGYSTDDFLSTAKPGWQTIQGYGNVFCYDDLPIRIEICSDITHKLDYLREIGLWDNLTFDWTKHNYMYYVSHDNRSWFTKNCSEDTRKILNITLC